VNGKAGVKYSNRFINFKNSTRVISYIRHTEIDREKWDACISGAANSMVYGYSWYLDALAPGWDALVLDDYDAVFPITWSRRFFISYLHQPFFTQQLGLFYTKPAQASLLEDFIKAIPRIYRFVQIHLNEGNVPADKMRGVKKRRNFVLDLSRPYQKIHKGYSEHCRRNLRKAEKYGVEVRTVSAREVVEFYISEKGDETPNIRASHYARLLGLCDVLAGKGMLHTVGGFEEGTLVAVGLFILHNGRLIYLMGTANIRGRNARASFLIIDHMIRNAGEQAKLLDFEGSEINGIARFYKGFGAEKRPYTTLYINRLPWPLRWLK
jgi:hypothetical protein